MKRLSFPTASAAALLVAALGGVNDVMAQPSVRGFECGNHRVFLDGKYHLYWCTSEKYLKVLMQAETTGWVGLGFAPTPATQMKGADIVMGYVAGDSSNVVLEDYIGLKAVGSPTKDTDRDGRNDLVHVQGWEEDGWTSIQFDRLLAPTDPNDRVLDMTRKINIIVAYGSTDDLSDGHDVAEVAYISPYSSLESYGRAPNNEYRTINGSGNNKDHPTWGQRHDHYIWKGQNAYDDGISAPAGPNRPLARVLSNEIFGRSDHVQNVDVSMLLIYVGQLLAHDISETESSDEYWPIHIPAGDPIFDIENTTSSNMSFHRSAYKDGTGTSTSNPRLQTNGQTSYIDGSFIYGMDDERAMKLRSMVDGKLELDEHQVLPDFVSAPVGMASELQCPCRMRSAGDKRANVHSVLFSLHTIFVREHNRWCDLLKDVNPSWDDEILYQEARRRVIAIWQKIALYEYLPAVLGKPPVLWTQYDPTIEPRLTHEFNVAAFRYGHSELPNMIYRFDAKGDVVEGGHLMLAENLFDGHHGLFNHAVESILRGAIRQRPGKSDLRFASGPRNFLFGNPRGTTINATDLTARSIQRGRDHGIEDYKASRRNYNLPVPTKWSDITSDEEDIALLERFFPNCEDADLYVGGLAETKDGSSLVGPLYAAILEDDFSRLRDGDRFWFENGQFSEGELSEILDTRLADVIKRNSNLTNIDVPDNVFYLDKRYTSFAITETGFPDARAAGFADPIRYDNTLTVMPGTYQLLWSADEVYVNFMMIVKTAGWIGIGFEPNQRGIMVGADIVIARFVDNKLEIKDYKAIRNVGKPSEDVELGGKDDIEDADGVLLDGWSMVRFRRKRVTGDGTGDKDGTDRELYIDRDVYTIFAFQAETNEFQYHGHNVHGEPILFRPSQVEVETLVEYGSGLHAVAVALCVIGVVLTFLLFLFQLKYRNANLIKLSSPAINNVMFVGAILAYVSMPFFTMDSTYFCSENVYRQIIQVTTFLGDPNRAPTQPCSRGVSTCHLRLWLLSLGFTLVFSSMFSKMYRVNRILVKASKDLKRVVVKNSDLYKIIALLFVIDLIVLVLWTIVDPFHLVRTFTGTQKITTAYFERFTSDNCRAGTDIFWGIMFGYKAVLLALAAYFATATRNVEIPGMRDFHAVGMAIYSIVMVCCIVLPGLHFLQSDVKVSAILSMGSIFLCTTTSLLILFIPKLHVIKMKNAVGVSSGGTSVKSESHIRPSESRGPSMHSMAAKANKSSPPSPTKK